MLTRFDFPWSSSCEQELLAENEEIGPEEEDMWYLRRLDGGLFTQQTVDYILAWIAMEDDGVRHLSLSSPQYDTHALPGSNAHSTNDGTEESVATGHCRLFATVPRQRGRRRQRGWRGRVAISKRNPAEFDKLSKVMLDYSMLYMLLLTVTSNRMYDRNVRLRQ